MKGKTQTNIGSRDGSERLTGLGKNQKEKEHHQGKTAELTSLGKKLLGLEPWAA